MAEFDYRDVLLKAASYVEQGWCQGWLWLDETGRGEIVLLPQDTRPKKVCLQGAIELAARDLGVDHMPAFNHMSNHIGVHAAGESIAPYEWNDAEGRTSDEVAEALRQAADA